MTRTTRTGAWGALRTFYRGQSADPRIALDADGAVLLAWRHSNYERSSQGWVMVDSVSRAGRIGTPRVVSSARATGLALAARVGGEAVLTWSNSGDEQGGLSHSVRPAGGDWAAQQQLDGGGEGPLALLADGTALAAFANTTFAPFDGVKVTARPSGGRFAAPEPVSSAGGWPALAAAGSHAIVVWRQPPYVRLHVAFRERGA